MKSFKDLVSDLPTNTTVVVSGNFNPPCSHHDMFIQGARKLSEELRTSFEVYLCRGGLLPEEKQETHFRAAFPTAPFRKVPTIIPLDEDVLPIFTLSESHETVLYELSENTHIISTVAAMNVEAASGNFARFKPYLPIGMKDIDCRRLMDDIREALGGKPVSKSPPINPLRDSYLKGDKYLVGEMVEASGEPLKIVRRGTNYLVCENTEGRKVTKWLHEVTNSLNSLS